MLVAALLFTLKVWAILGVLQVIHGLIIYGIIKITGKRVHGIEMHEESWFPETLRDLILMQLQGGWELYQINSYFGGLNPAQTIGHVISDFIENKHQKYQNIKAIFDVCSGASGPTHIIHQQILKNQRSVLFFWFFFFMIACVKTK